VDVREPHEWARGHIPAATHIPLGFLLGRIADEVPDRATPIVAYCAHGSRSLLAARMLESMGYADVVSMAGGFVGWRSLRLPVDGDPAMADARPTNVSAPGPAAPGPAGGPGGSSPGGSSDVRSTSALTDAQRVRYGRHLVLPEVGETGQARLLASRVLVVGAGGLGSSALLYLAAAGVGTIGVVDFDTVDLSNLQRQVIHTTESVGRPKVASAAAAIAALDPDVRVIAHEVELHAGNAGAIVAGYDVVVDGTDSFEARYALNDAAVARGIPVVHASVFRSEGLVTVLDPPRGPCYRCLYPTAPPPELAPACEVAGVLGVVPGILGLLQASEVLKLLLRVGETLTGRLLLFDAMEGSFEEAEIRRDPACPSCGHVLAIAPA
jgi:molybdopterin/thiamine biosynthesis adenylyltransferase/rhodanese-related sulfurtransferase